MHVVVDGTSWAPVDTDGLCVVEPVPVLTDITMIDITVGTVVATGCASSINIELVSAALTGGLIEPVKSGTEFSAGGVALAGESRSVLRATGVVSVEVVIMAEVTVSPVLVKGWDEFVVILTLNAAMLIIILNAQLTAAIIALREYTIVWLSIVIIIALTAALCYTVVSA